MPVHRRRESCHDRSRCRRMPSTVWQLASLWFSQEIFPSETAAMADVLLPGVTWAEKEGTYTNTDRRIQLGRQAIDPLGDARPDWIIMADLARRIMERENRVPLGPQAAWQYSRPRKSWKKSRRWRQTMVASATNGWNAANNCIGPYLHWIIRERRFFMSGSSRAAKGKFHIVEHLPPHEIPDSEYPMVLTTGRVLYHWHGAEMTRRRASAARALSGDDCGNQPGRCGKDRAERPGYGARKIAPGEMIARALVTDRVCPGLIFGNFHFPGQQNVNNLTIAALDPISKIPEYKVCAVRLEPVG